MTTAVQPIQQIPIQAYPPVAQQQQPRPNVVPTAPAVYPQIPVAAQARQVVTAAQPTYDDF